MGRNGNLTFKADSLDYNGEYMCRISNIIGRVEKSFKLIIKTHPQISSIDGPRVIKVYSTLNLYCNSSGSPEPHITWFFNGNKVTKSQINIIILYLLNLIEKYLYI